MNKRRNDIIKRVIPLLLVAIMLLSTILGLVGSVMAYAAEDESLPIVNLSSTKLISGGFYGNDSEPLEPGTEYSIQVVLQFKKQWGNDNIRSVSVPDKDGIFSDGNLQFEYISSSRVEDASGKKENLYSIYVLEGLRVNKTTYTVPVNIRYADDDTPDDTISLTVPVTEPEPSPEPSPSASPSPTKSPKPTTPPGSSNDKWDTYYPDSSSSSKDEPEVLTTPKMIITKFKAPEVINPEDDFDVSISFMNNSSKKNMENIAVTVTPSEGAVIKNGLNKRHFLVIPKRKSTSETYTFRASKNLKQEAITLNVKFDYQYKVDGAYKDASSEEIISIYSIPKEEEEEEKEETGTEGEISAFEILSVIPPEDVFAGEEGYLTVRVINKDHQFDASNVQLTVTGDGLQNNGNTQYHGALTHSTQAEIEMPLQFTKPGTYKLEAIVTYEDALGRDKKNKPIVRINDLRKEFTVTVAEAPKQPDMNDMMGGMEMPPADMPAGAGVSGMVSGLMAKVTALGPGVLIVIGIGVLAVIVAAVLFVKHKRKKAEDEDETI